jgi:antitoxin component of RelBE/YafQ-DinJ toxin-antitoxin module
MDAKITLSFDASVIEKAKEFADDLGISLSRFTEIMYRKVLDSGIRGIEDLPISAWVHQVAEEQAEYNTRKKTRDQLKKEFFESMK